MCGVTQLAMESYEYGNDESYSYDSQESIQGDYIDVLWIQKVFGCSRETIINGIVKAFEEVDMTVKVTRLYISTMKGKDHAYLLLDSVEATQMLYQGDIEVILTSPEGTEVSVWFQTADRKAPKEKQDPYSVFFWNLPMKNREEVEEELSEQIFDIVECEYITVNADPYGKGNCSGTAKVGVSRMIDARKLIYMFNFAEFMGQDIRAAFCNKDYKIKPRKSRDTGKSKRKETSRRKDDNGSRPKGRRKRRGKKKSKGPDAKGWHSK